MTSLSLGVVGVGAAQINNALDAVFARIADLSGPTYLWYAIRVQQLPLALFGIALSGALLPPLARAIQSNEMEKYKELLRGAQRQAAALMIPSTFALFALGEGGLRILYRHGNFSEEALTHTLHCLWGYGAGLVPAVAVLLLAGGFYARKSYRIPVAASLICVACNIGLNAFLVFGLGWGGVSIAIATSVSSFLNALILTHFLKKECGAIHNFPFLGKMTICSAIPAALVSFLGGNFFIQAALYGISVLILARLFKIDELLNIFRKRAA